MPKKQVSLTLDENLIEVIHAEAKAQGRNFSNMSEYGLTEHFKEKYPHRLKHPLGEGQ